MSSAEDFGRLQDSSLSIRGIVRRWPIRENERDLKLLIDTIPANLDVIGVSPGQARGAEPNDSPGAAFSFSIPFGEVIAGVVVQT